MPIDPGYAAEAKAIVVRAFRNGPLEDIHAGTLCPVCAGDPTVSHVTQAEMKTLVKYAVREVYSLLLLRKNDPDAYAELVAKQVLDYARNWDDPEVQ